ncbi:glycoside hydrolase family 3 N-terminal domain-containing protein, partial [Chloroflexota bacterium]
MKNSRYITVIIVILIIISVSFPTLNGLAALEGQPFYPDQRIESLLDQMTPEEKVGQLFLVTFNGSILDDSTQIYDLVVEHNVGGVVLLKGNDNFTEAPGTIEDGRNLIRDMQSLVWSKAQGQIIDPLTTTRSSGNYIPLFVGLTQEGDGYPNDQILSGLTSLPGLMALGATWRPELSMQVGKIAGQELSSIGINMFIGPSLDVLTSSGISGGSDLDARAFGGDPYWVGEMGLAYISGLHEGSQNRLAVIAKHFPGKGSSDRSSFQEVATVRKSLDQLKQIELDPFFQVTKNLPGDTDAVDGLLVSHIRYQGFQGNIRTTTKPVSFDPQALSQILELAPFSNWRSSGGLIVSDDLGSQAVRRFYDPANQSFFARIIARDAFLAGNDLLYMGNIISTDAEDNYSTIINTLGYFAQKYNEDAAFAQRVDGSVRRILELKYRLFGDFGLSEVLTFSDLTEIGNSQAVTLEVASQAATLISPNALDLDVLVPSPPGYYERILFLTDTKQQQQCSACLVEPSFGKDAFLEAVLKLYGPQAGGLVNRGFMASYNFEDLSKILLGGEGDADLESELNNADWIVISILDSNSEQSLLEILRRFLFERQDILRNKKVMLFAFNAPYYLDATDISKLTAYYGLYSKSQPFIDVAARLLFKELTPLGDLPVS